MKVTVWLNADGAEVFANGGALYPYHLSLRVEGCKIYSDTPKDSFKIGDVDTVLPGRRECIKVAEAKLKAKLSEVRAEAYKEEQLIKTRLENLLALEYSPAEAKSRANVKPAVGGIDDFLS